MFIFLDESGNFKGDKIGYFVAGGFVISDQKVTAKEFRKWQRRKFISKKLRYRTEVKFSDTRLTDDLRAKTLLYFTRQNIRVFYIFLRKENIPLEFWGEKGLESGHLYAEIIAATLELLSPIVEPEVRVFIDERHLKGISRTSFRERLRVNFLTKLPTKTRLEIEIVNSATNTNIQIADWICGALYRYYSGRKSGKRFYDILHGSIVAFDELFKDYWTNNKKFR